MSDLRPAGVPVNFDGVDREFLFTLNVIDEAETAFGKPMIEILKDTIAPRDGKTLKKLVTILVNDDVERYNATHGAKRRPVTEKYVGSFLTMDLHGGNLVQMTEKVLEAYKVSTPEAEDDNPNQSSGRQKI